MDPENQRIGAAWEAVARALVRGGHVDEPAMAVQLAAVNYYVREDMSRVIADALDDGRAWLRMDGDTMLLGFLDSAGKPEVVDGEEVAMEVARVSRQGKVRYL